jgi:hypothetical protein
MIRDPPDGVGNPGRTSAAAKSRRLACGDKIGDDAAITRRLAI